MRIIIEENGRQRVIDDALAYTIWTRQDIRDAVFQKTGREPGDDFINKVISETNWDAVEDCSDSWAEIEEAILIASKAIREGN